MMRFDFLKIPKVRAWIAVVLAIIIGFYLFWLYEKYYPSTDNAYVQAHVVQMAPQVTGPILALYIKNYQTVKKGDPLFDIDPAPFQAAANKAAAQLDVIKQHVNGLEKAVKAAEAVVIQREAERDLAKKNYERSMTLVKKGLVTLTEGDRLTSQLNVTEAALTAARDELSKAQAELGDSDHQNAQVRQAQAELDQANLNLAHTHVTAPMEGYIVNLTARVGSTAQKETPLFAIIDASQWWVDANFKETQLARIRVGQSADVIVDTYPQHTFEGVVQNISRGSGAAFSLFPPENATGNWVKITQRFTVRILLVHPDAAFPLRLGASATATVNTLKRIHSPL